MGCLLFDIVIGILKLPLRGELRGLPTNLPPGCLKTYQLLSFCHGERSRAISLDLQERVLRSFDCAPLDDRMIVSEEFSDNLPRGSVISSPFGGS